MVEVEHLSKQEANYERRSVQWISYPHATISICESYILALNIAERTQLSPEYLAPGGLTGKEYKPPNLSYLSMLLRFGYTERGES
jgi:hypothetical protein